MAAMIRTPRNDLKFRQYGRKESMNDKQAEKDRFEFEPMECYLTKVKYFGRHQKVMA